MNNRILAILVLTFIIGFGYLYYKFEYAPYKQQQLQQKLEDAQKPPEPTLTKQESEQVTQETTQITNTQKIEQLKEKSRVYKDFTLENSSRAYFKENGETLDLFYNDNKIGNFDLVKSQDLKVNLVNGDNKDLYIQIGQDKYFYNNITGKISKLDLKLDIIYAKQGTNLRIIFVTGEGSFVYSISNNSLEYFTYFNDFVYYKDGYVGIVKSDEKRILTNLSYEDVDNKAILVYYNPSTKEKKIIYSTDLDILKLYTENNYVYVKTSDDGIYKLDNF